MARIRTIKPEFFTSEDIVALSPMARLLYIALWCEADREGRLQWKPKTMKLRYFPADQCDVMAMADELVAGGLVVLYEDGELAYIPSFNKHQHINPRESESQLPAPVDKSRKRRAVTRDDASARVDDAQGGREGKGRERKEPPNPLRGKPAEPAGFDEFWSAYPRKVARGAALKAWAKAKPDEPLRQVILAAIGRARDGPDWRKDGGAFIPHPATWLNAQRWLDEPVTMVAVAPAVEVWKPPPAMTAEERAASDEARRRVMSALKVVA